MKAIELKKRFFQDPVFIVAILVSAIWHIFWLSIVSVSTVPREIDSIRFSKVSFLGPMPASRALEMRVEPGSRSLPEKRFFKFIENLTPPDEFLQKTGHDIDAPYKEEDGVFTSLVKDSLAASKLEPEPAI